MGKGDKKTKRGKLFSGTYGVRRKRKITETYKPAQKPPEEAKEKKKITEVSKPAKPPAAQKRASKSTKSKEVEEIKKNDESKKTDEIKNTDESK